MPKQYLNQMTGRLRPAAAGLMGVRGFGETIDQDGSRNQAVLEQANAGFVQQRMRRIDMIRAAGDVYWLHVDLTIGAVAPVAGTQTPLLTAPVDTDLLILGARSNLALSTMEITDQSRTRPLTSGRVLINSIATFCNKAGTVVQEWRKWGEEDWYYLPANIQLALTIYADGTETNGILDFYCKRPPTQYS